MQGKTENPDVPAGVVDVILDTDTYNGTALSVKKGSRADPQRTDAFGREQHIRRRKPVSRSPADGMEKSYAGRS